MGCLLHPNICQEHKRERRTEHKYIHLRTNPLVLEKETEQMQMMVSIPVSGLHLWRRCPNRWHVPGLGAAQMAGVSPQWLP